MTLASVFAAQDASAYCRTTSCPGVGTGARCEPAQPTDCGKELFWKSGCVGFSMQKDASVQISLADATQVFQDAFQIWANADCGGGTHPRIVGKNLGPAECNVHEYNKTAGNANVIMFHDDSWPHSGANSTLALTTVTYNVDTGEIYDADMELNSANVKFSVSDQSVTYDLSSIAVHEVGHFLGLSHSPDPSATMFADYAPGSVGLRSLEADDIAGMCAVYPPGDPIPATCDASPRRGFETECSPLPATNESQGSCSMTSDQSHSRGFAAILAMGLAIGLSTKRRRARAGRS